ncbi:acyl-CoA ligase [Arthroderma uncinatum]|uniref:acyl-CoA ligase n=1 Tax=Arthroderma uncinatum TaxID=74035 RepID=UPI00144ADB9E|nr:acyl-CoA ligase [Arthroderma uncinatum]KAF3482465.1 acyl-CoA ligase [Arthroderma uncinatum]
MVFYPPARAGELPKVPDDVPICDFMLDEKSGRMPFASSRNPFICGITGRTYSVAQAAERVDVLARALAREFGWHPNRGSEWEKVVGIYSFNSIDYLVLCWAIHKLSGIVSAANAVYSAPELAHQLKDSRCRALFTCLPSLPDALEAAEKAGIPKSRVYIIDLPAEFTGSAKTPTGFKTLEQFITEGYSLPPLEKTKWAPGQGAKQTAFLCYSSGTSGLPKGVMIAHRNVIANTMQIKQQEQSERDARVKDGKPATGVSLGLLPQSHIYALVVLCHVGPYRGDSLVILPKFDMAQYLGAIQKHRISTLYLVPPIIIAMLRNKAVCDKVDLSSVSAIFTGAAPLGKETAEELLAWKPSWAIKQGYGLTETCTVVSSTTVFDTWLGSSGCLLPGFEAKVVSPEGTELTGYDQPGELVVRSPSVVLGYLNNPRATAETFQDGWMRTGDEVVFRISPGGTEHLFIVDRIKELIKVKGMQVAPAELEAHVLSHPDVADCAVIPVPDERAGELPKAFVVRGASAAGKDDAELTRSIQQYVEEHKARHKWLKGGVEFIDVIPKSPSGKILRRLLRDREKETRRKKEAKL